MTHHDHPQFQFDGPVVVVARRTDPETSKEAAAAFEQPKAARSVRVCVAILTAHGPLTDFQLATLWAAYWEGPFSFSLPAKARHWARQAGLVRHEGFAQHNGRRVRTWALGRDEAFLTQGTDRKFCPHCGEPIP